MSSLKIDQNLVRKIDQPSTTIKTQNNKFEEKHPNWLIDIY